MDVETYALSYAEKRDWLRLIRTPTIGPVAFRALLQRYGSASSAIQSLPALLRGKPVSVPDADHIEAEMDALASLGINLLALCEPDYPIYLRALDPPPPLICVWGRPEILSRPCVAIVGSRNASAMGQKFAQKISRELGEAGYTIVSGLARGIDTNAHSGSLETGTAAVLGGGVDHVYPSQNADLFEDIKRKGALISESPLGYRATARDFPRRNRIISGLCLGVVVIEAAERSGTLITARYALEQNREVMAAPGSPLDPRTKGCNRLIRQGATLIENLNDILDVLNDVPRLSLQEPENFFSHSTPSPEVSDDDVDKARDVLVSLMSSTPTSKDDLIRASGLAAPVAIAALLELELVGDIHVEPDGRMSLNYAI